MAASTKFIARTVQSLGSHGMVSQRDRGEGCLAGDNADSHPFLPWPEGAGVESMCFQKTPLELGREAPGGGAM